MQILDRFFETSTRLMAIVGSDHHMIQVNNCWCQQLGWTKETLTSRPLSSFVSHETSIKLEEMLNSESPHAIEAEVLSADGDTREFIFIFRKLEDENLCLLIGNDIADFRDINYITDDIQNISQLGFWRYDLFSDHLFWSNEIYRIHELPLDSSITSDMALRYVVHEYHQNLRDQFRKCQQTGHPFDIEVKIATRSAERKWIRIIGKPKIVHGQIVGLYGTIQDVSSFRQKLTSLDETQSRLQLALSANRMGVWDWNVQDDLLYWDDSMFPLFEVKKEEFGHNFASIEKLMHPDDRSKVIELVKRTIEFDVEFDTSFRIVTSSGKIKHIAAKAKLNKGNAVGTWMTGVNWDVTHEKENEQVILSQRAQMISSARLSSLGEMASGIAHEVNNPLGIILARANQLERKISEGKFAPRDIINGLKNIEDTCDRIMKIIKGLRAFSRDAEHDPKSIVQSSDVINEVIALTLEKFKINQITLRVDLHSNESIMANSVQLGQVFMNLISNAFDATKDQDERWVLITSKTIDHIIRISVIDSGPQIPDYVIEKIYEPFFSTKDVGKGTGLGLPISKGIVEEHGGKLWIDCDSKYTCFNVDIPIYVEDQLSL